MTLITAWRTRDSIVVHADSQETVGDYRATVKKIVPVTMGQFSVIAIGAGQPGDLLDSFSTRLARAVNGKINSIQEFGSTVETVLRNFYKSDVNLCPYPGKIARFLIGACHASSKQYDAWVTENITIRKIRDDEPELMGWDEPLYRHTAKRFFSTGMSIAQAVLAGVYVMTVAADTSNYVRDPFNVAIIRDTGIWTEPMGYVSDISLRLQDYDRRVHEILLACSDTSIPVADLKNTLSQFAETAAGLHRSQMDKVVEQLSLGTAMRLDHPYAKLPRPNLLHWGPKIGLSIEHDPVKVEEFRALVEELTKIALAQNWPFMCAECGSDYEFNISKLGGSDWACPSCKYPIKTVGAVDRYRKVGESDWISVMPPSVS
jgi:hypothetical protein